MKITTKPTLPTQGAAGFNRHKTGVRRYTAWPSDVRESGFYEMDCPSWMECLDAATESRNYAALRSVARWSQDYFARMIAREWCVLLGCDAPPAIRVTFPRNRSVRRVEASR